LRHGLPRKQKAGGLRVEANRIRGERHFLRRDAPGNAKGDNG
jgi:hypothetical protein